MLRSSWIPLAVAGIALVGAIVLAGTGTRGADPGLAGDAATAFAAWGAARP